MHIIVLLITLPLVFCSNIYLNIIGIILFVIDILFTSDRKGNDIKVPQYEKGYFSPVKGMLSSFKELSSSQIDSIKKEADSIKKKDEKKEGKDV